MNSFIRRSLGAVTWGLACASATSAMAQQNVSTVPTSGIVSTAVATANTWTKVDEGAKGNCLIGGIQFNAKEKRFVAGVNSPKDGRDQWGQKLLPAGASACETGPGKWVPAENCATACDPSTGQLYAFTEKLYRYNQKSGAWSVVDTKTRLGAEPYDMFTVQWPSLCWLPGQGELMLANGTAPFGGTGTWLYKPEDNDWRQLTFGSPLINGKRAEVQILYTTSQDLLAAARNRHYRTETMAAAKADLPAKGKSLAAAIRAQAAKLAAATSADLYEQQQLKRARTALEPLAAKADELAKLLAAEIPATLLTDLEDGLSEPLRTAREELAVEPPPRCHSPLLWHPVAKKVLMFGGDGHNRAYADTWAFDPATSRWMQLHPPCSPEPRAGHALLWLPKAQTVLLTGHSYTPNQNRGIKGLYETLPMEMWTFDLATNSWSLIKRLENDQQGPQNDMSMSGCASFATDPDDCVVGTARIGYYPQEQVWSLWRCQVDAKTVDQAATTKYAVTPGTVAYFGGSKGYDIEPAETIDAVEQRLANLPPNQWTRITVPKSADHGYNGNWGTLVLDPERDQILWWRGGHAGYCGNDVAQYSLKANTWNVSYRPSHPLSYEGSCVGLAGNDFDGRPWQNMHSYRRYGYDPVARRMVINLRHTYTYDPDRRAWDGTRYDNPGGVMNMVATPQGMVGSGARDANMYRFDATKGWGKLPMNGKWPSVCIYDTSFVYDSTRDRILAMGKGLVGNVKPGEVWSYDLKTGDVADLKAANADKIKIGGEGSRETAYIPEADIIVCDAGGPDFNYVYDVGKNAWRTVKLAPKNLGQGGFGNGLQYDAKRKLLIAIFMEGYDWHVWATRFDPKTAPFSEL